MLLNLKKLTLGLALLGALVLPLASPSVAIAQIDPGSKEAACDGISGATGVSCDPGSTQSEDTVRSLLRTALNILSWVVGVVAVFMIIIGGFKFVTSGGDANNTKSARDTIIYALVGLVVVVLSQIIVRFVLKESTEAVNQP